jgi:signal transduction histidine kinase
MSTMAEASPGPEGWTDGPGALIRTWDGHITFWSREMEHRYGFAPEEAVGQVAHKLLRTSSCQTLTEIEAQLAEREIWRGGLIHHRADGQPLIVANHWHLHREAEGQETFVTELHSDIVPPGAPAGSDLADILATMAHEVSEPLTAIGNYMSAAQRALHPAWPDKVRAGQAIDAAIRQLARARETLAQVRALGAGLRDPRQRELHANLTATMERTERNMQRSHAAVVSATRTQTEQSLTRAVSWQNVQLFHRLLQQRGADRLDAHTERTVARLLEEEKAKLATHGRR